MKYRWARTCWIIVINSLAIYFVVFGSSEVRAVKSYLEHTTPTPSTTDYAKGVLPAAGILFELLRSRVAAVINVGYFFFVAAIFGVLAIFNWSDAHARAYLLMLCIGAICVTAINGFLYRRIRPRCAVGATGPGKS